MQATPVASASRDISSSNNNQYQMQETADKPPTSAQTAENSGVAQIAVVGSSRSEMRNNQRKLPSNSRQKHSALRLAQQAYVKPTSGGGCQRQIQENQKNFQQQRGKVHTETTQSMFGEKHIQMEDTLNSSQQTPSVSVNPPSRSKDEPPKSSKTQRAQILTTTEEEQEAQVTQDLLSVDHSQDIVFDPVQKRKQKQKSRRARNSHSQQQQMQTISGSFQAGASYGFEQSPRIDNTFKLKILGPRDFRQTQNSRQSQTFAVKSLNQSSPQAFHTDYRADEVAGGHSLSLNSQESKLYDVMRDNSTRRKIVQSQDCRLKHLLEQENSSMERLRQERHAYKLLQRFEQQRLVEAQQREDYRSLQVELAQQRYMQTQNNRLQNVVSLEVSNQALSLARACNREELQRERAELRQLKCVNDANDQEARRLLAQSIRHGVRRQQQKIKTRFRAQEMTNRFNYDQSLQLHAQHGADVNSLMTQMEQTHASVRERIEDTNHAVRKLADETCPRRRMLAYLSKRKREQGGPKKSTFNMTYHTFNTFSPSLTTAAAVCLADPGRLSTHFAPGRSSEYTPRHSVRDQWSHSLHTAPEANAKAKNGLEKCLVERNSVQEEADSETNEPKSNSGRD